MTKWLNQNMATLFDTRVYENFRDRIEGLKPEAIREWGKMDVAQMLAHCNIPIEQALGKIQLPSSSNLFFRTIVKWLVLARKPFGKNLPTVPGFEQSDPKDFEREKTRLLQNLREFHQRGRHAEWAIHSGFGKLKAEEWSWLTEKHLDHHLRQFAA
jgi:hypothetical protein